MTDSDTNVTPEGQGNAQAQRLPLLAQVATAVGYMRTSANTEFKRSGDMTNAILLPVSCILLVVAICLSTTPQLKLLSFALPLLTFGYYIANRIGIVRTFNGRQAYLTWHILIATFLLGGTAALFMVYLSTCIIMAAMHQAT